MQRVCSAALFSPSCPRLVRFGKLPISPYSGGTNIGADDFAGLMAQRYPHESQYSRKMTLLSKISGWRSEDGRFTTAGIMILVSTAIVPIVGVLMFTGEDTYFGAIIRKRGQDFREYWRSIKHDGNDGTLSMQTYANSTSTESSMEMRRELEDSLMESMTSRALELDMKAFGDQKRADGPHGNEEIVRGLLDLD
eukprot:TRINITY_DN57106_c0_g1_i1.p1 TRINITY_DN57106_c0_g1~~TRINITY_DN57106_c0_g1_i1.p1  ORF type:complete len:194 (+),score=14.32 TRINITY_DN57106_c0_g1_i1:125-706(+)